MDPITLIGIIGSAASVISLLRSENQTNISVERVTNVVIENSQHIRTEGQYQRQVDLLDEVSREEVVAAVDIVVQIASTDQAFLDRIQGRCIRIYEDAIKDMRRNEASLDEAFEAARQCVCKNIKLARKTSGGRFPSDSFQKLWDQFQCGM